MTQAAQLDHCIRFLNHASFIVTSANATLLVDPYLSGSAFNNGWDLIWRDVEYEGLDKVTHIWFSHEHPDHFAPAFLHSIPKERRSQITILYQETADKRVAAFCRKIGFEVVELADMMAHKIDQDFEVTCSNVPFYDSWLFIAVNGLRIMNMNDCIVDRKQLESIATIARNCDVLFTQFSYAGGAGTVENAAPRREQAADVLGRIQTQCEALHPKFVVPFASFIHFSHEENAWMNDSVNFPASAVAHVRNYCKSIPVLLTPNEQWDGRSSRDPQPATDQWTAKYQATLAAPPLHHSVVVPEAGLLDASTKFRNKIFQRNSETLIKLLAATGVLPAVTFYLRDLAMSYNFSWDKGLVRAPAVSANQADMSLGSDSLAFLFSQDYGINTLYVNARFSASEECEKKVTRTFSVPALNNTGRYLNWSLAKLATEPKFLKKGLQRVGLMRAASAG